MKTLLTTLALATLIVAPAFTKSAAAARARDASQLVRVHVSEAAGEPDQGI